MNQKIACLIITALLLSSCGFRAASPTLAAGTTAPTTTGASPQSNPTETGSTAVSPAKSPTAIQPSETTVTAQPGSTPQPTPAAPVAGIHLKNPITPEQLTMIKEAGVHWTRTDVFHWNQIEPIKSSPAVYDWSSVDEQSLQIASADGLQFVASVLYAPAWAQKSPGVLCGAVAEGAMDAFANFVGALVSRYSQPPFNVKYWEIGNEPDIDPTLVPPDSGYGCWGNKADAYYGGGYYARVLQAVYPKLKTADPEAQLIIGGLLLDCDPVKPPEVPAGSGNLKDCTPSKFLEGILKNGGANAFDGISLHSYDYYGGTLGNYSNPNWHSGFDKGGPALIAKAEYISSLLVSYSAANKYLLGTELAILCGRDGTESICMTPEYEETKASYLVQAMTYAQVYHFRAMTWYGLFGWRGSGLVTRSLAPLPAYEALKFYTALVGEAVFKRSINDLTGVSGYEFINGGQTIWVLWSADGKNHSTSLPSAPQNIYNLNGDTLPVQPGINIGTEPVYVVW